MDNLEICCHFQMEQERPVVGPQQRLFSMSSEKRPWLPAQGFSRPCERAMFAKGWWEWETGKACCLPKVPLHLPILFHCLLAFIAFCACRGNSASSARLHFCSFVLDPTNFLSIPVSWLGSHRISPNTFNFALLFFPYSFSRHWAVDKQSVISIWPEKVEILHKARKEKQLFFCVWFSQQCSPPTHQFLDATFRASSKRNGRWHSIFHVTAYIPDEVNITLS